MINSRLLKQFFILSQEENYARAAQRLFVAQPTLSRNIQSLEESFGQKLFDRSQRHLMLTPFGKMVVQHAEKITMAMTALDNEVMQFTNLQSGILNIGVGPFPAESSFSKTIGFFNAQYPKIIINPDINNWEYLHQQLLLERIEFFVAETSDLKHNKNLEITPFTQHPAFFYCKTTHPILEKKKITLKDCIQYTLIHTALPKRVKMTPESAINLSDAFDAKIKCDDLGMSKSIVINSQAIGIGTYGTTKELLLEQKIQIIPITSPNLKTHYGIVKKKGATLSPAAVKFLELLDKAENELCRQEIEYFSSIHKGLFLR